MMAACCAETLSPLTPPDVDVAVVVLNWNNWSDTRDCLRSLQGVGRVILVDNASTDRSVHLARSGFPQVEIVQNSSNLGFAGGNNAGIAHALATGADYVMLLNNDTEVDPVFLGPLVQALEALPGLGFACPRIYYADRPEQTWFEFGTIDWRRGVPYYTEAPAEPGSTTLFGSGCCLLAHRDTWRAVGFLDPRFFLYWEDADWTLRVIRAGGVGVVVAESRVWHKVSQSTSQISGLASFYYARNGLLFNALHSKRPRVTMTRFVLWRLRELARAIRRHDEAWARSCILEMSGYCAFVGRRFGAAPPLVVGIARLASWPRSKRWPSIFNSSDGAS